MMKVKVTSKSPILEFRGQKWGNPGIEGIRDVNEMPESMKLALIANKKLIEVKETTKKGK